MTIQLRDVSFLSMCPLHFVYVLNRQLIQTYQQRWGISVKDLTELIPVRHNMSQDRIYATCILVQETTISVNGEENSEKNKYHTVVTSVW